LLSPVNDKNCSVHAWQPIDLAKAELLRTMLRRNSTPCVGNACSRCLNTPTSVSGYIKGNFTLDVLDSRVRRLLPLPNTVNRAARLMLAATHPSLPTGPSAITSAPTVAPVALPR
jgi:hypothetical protein